MKHFTKYPTTRSVEASCGTKKITASEDGRLTNADVVRILKDHGIDTTKCQYELKAEEYERYSRGQHYVKKFACPGDYLAYLAMLFHRGPNAALIDAWYGGKEGFIEEIEDHPTVEDMAEYACSIWWGDGDDFIYYLKNLTTGDILYQSDESPEYYEDDEEDEWDED